MDETSTQTINVTTNPSTVKESDVLELLDADELVFYHAIRTDLDTLQRVPQQQTIDNILNFSKGLR
ncbi:hypothetical protein [Mucilaginibacter myungsuensis]|uniref:Uncharacterized protein n=1 Tax=Mucilaginibacter myungsuensis TaxID=649104 RepID=A0A929L0Y9_9SPHI|nr:hypothetical protein [Mucilaginibacter myungsuensis]MBE9664240.1 hypothetical protein [Mucilaginibacter myungsuensis]MDN3599944.1 hypothetical protein [Mucilaginibacter myungsuensis]